MFQLGELPEGEKNSLLEQLDTAERVAMEERLESSYRQIREYQDTLYQSQEQMDGARAFIESSEVSHTVFSVCYTGASYSNMLYKHTNKKKTKKYFLEYFS